MSRTSRFDLQRDTQIIMNSLDACSSSLRTESRWSITLDDLDLAGAADALYAERGLGTGFDAAEDALVRWHGDRLAGQLQVDLEALVAPRPRSPSAAEPLQVQAARGQFAHLASTAVSKPSGPQQYTSVPSAMAQQRLEVEEAGLVLRTTVTRSP